MALNRARRIAAGLVPGAPVKDLRQLAHLCITGQVDSIQAVGESIEDALSQLEGV